MDYQALTKKTADCNDWLATQKCSLTIAPHQLKVIPDWHKKLPIDLIAEIAEILNKAVNVS